MTTEHRAESRLDDYFTAWLARLWRREWLLTAAALSALVLLITAVVVWLAMREGFAGWLMWPARALLLVLLAGGIWWLLRRRQGQLRSSLGATVERRVPQFSGRALTWLGLASRRTPLLALLAEDTLKVADQHAPAAVLKPHALALPAAGAAAALGVLLWLAVAGPGLWSYGVRELWLGWALPGLLPNQALLVTPGDSTLRRGANLSIVVKPKGFTPAAVTLYARRGSGAWQPVPLSASAGRFEFTFYAVREPLQYYVASAGVQSPRYNVQLVDVPGIENLKLVYHYPDWTHRADETHEPGGDINAIAGTSVNLEVRADAPLADAELVQDSAAKALDVSGNTAHGALDVKQDGRYYLATRIGGERVRLTDDYFIKLQPDAPPQVKVTRPGRDYSASSIEEVAARVEASDDYGLESLQLRYAVNGGAWQTLPLQAGATSARDDAVLMLENLHADSTGRALEPGDLISYYAVARDHTQSTQTDMYFIDVRPFDRRFEQGQAAGGGAGAGGGNDSDEISQRQRQILVSTWNLLRKKNSEKQDAPAAASQLADNSHLLSQLQKTLAEQARSLIQRSKSRELTEADDDVARFAKLMEAAAEAMDPAAQKLATVDLQAAIQPEQQALQQLLRAEAVYRDVQVTQQQGGGGAGGGGQSGRDLAQLYELEMDLQKNQYETGSTATPGSTKQQADELSQKLKELAARQEQLANEMRRQPQSTPQQRWQQEQLQREAEQLRQQLQQAQQGSQAQGGATQSAANGGNAGASSGAASQLESAIRSMSTAGQALNNGAEAQDPNRAARAAQAASEQLASAHGQLNQQQQASEQRSLQSLADRAASLYNTQAASDTQLQQSLRSLEGNTQSGADLSGGGLSFTQQRQLAADKRALAVRYLQLQSDLANQTQRLKASAPTTAATLEQVQQELRDAQVDTRIALAAQYIERGRAAYIAPSESMVTDELRTLRDTLQRVAAAGPATAVPEQQDAKLQQALAEVQRLRQELQQQVANAQRQGSNSQSGNSQSSDSPGTPAQGSGTQANATRGGAAPAAALGGELRSAGRAVGAVGPLLAGQGASQQEVEQLRSLAQQLQGARLGGSGDALEQELRRNLGLLEQLELRLRRTSAKQLLRASVTEPGTQDYEDAVAEYYRQLSR